MSNYKIPLVLFAVSLLLVAALKLVSKQGMSSEELDVLVESAKSAQYMANGLRADNERFFLETKENVRLFFDTEPDLERIAKAERIRENTDQLLKSLSDISADAVASAGGTDRQSNVKHPGRRVRMDGKKLFELVFQLNMYADSLSALSGTTIEKLTVSENNADGSALKFFDRYFKDKALGVLLMNLGRLECQVALMEREALRKIGSSVNYVEPRFDKLVPVVVPETNTVRVGEDYKAKIMVVAIPSDITPLMAVDGIKVPMEGSVGKVLVKPDVKPGDFKAGIAEKLWRGTVSISSDKGVISYNLYENYKVKAN